MKTQKKLCVIFIMFVIIASLFVLPKTYAVEDVDNTVEEEIVENEDEELINETTPTTYKTSTVHSISALPEANLNLNNILCFILIGIGLVNIILAIAVLINLKK